MWEPFFSQRPYSCRTVPRRHRAAAAAAASACRSKDLHTDTTVTGCTVRRCCAIDCSTRAVNQHRQSHECSPHRHARTRWISPAHVYHTRPLQQTNTEVQVLPTATHNVCTRGILRRSAVKYFRQDHQTMCGHRATPNTSLLLIDPLTQRPLRILKVPCKFTVQCRAGRRPFVRTGCASRPTRSAVCLARKLSARR